MQKFSKNVLINSKQMSCDSCKAALASDWLVFFSSMAGTKEGEEGKAQESQNESRGTCPTWGTPSAGGTSSAWGGGHSNPRWDGEEESRGREVGGGREVTGVVTDPTVGPDGCRGQAIYVRWGGASKKEAQTNHRRQGSLERVPEGQ